MGLFDRFKSRTPVGVRPAAPAPTPTYEVTFTIGEEVSRLSVPIDLEDFSLVSEIDDGPREEASECWVPAGKSVDVGQHRIEGGLVYVGRRLAAAESSYLREPALLDPSLDVADGRYEDGARYRASYESLGPDERGGFLRWLAGPRRRKDAEQTELFLYLYGLERRLLADPKSDPQARSERGVLVAELRRLRDEGEELEEEPHGSFATCLARLLDFLAAEDILAGGEEVHPPRESAGWDVPQTLRMMVGELASARLPLPAELAQSWILTSPEAHLRTPAERCRTEFLELFAIRYRERFGEGLGLPDGAPLRLSYRAASQGLSEAGRRTAVPDVCSSAQLIGPLRKLGQDCCEELSAYSRWIGRRPEGAGFRGSALLPAPLIAGATDPQVVSLRGLLERVSAEVEPWVLQAEELVDLWEEGAEKLTKKEATLLSQLVEKLGYGIEPDPRFGGTGLRRGIPAVIFPVGDGDPRAPSAAYAAATLVLRLMTAVAAADGTVSSEEEALLESKVYGVEELYPGERARLRAHLSWLTRSDLRLGGSQKDIASLSDVEREAIATIVVALAVVDGDIDPEEVKTLQRIFSLLGLDPQGVYPKLHAASSGEEAPGAHLDTPTEERASAGQNGAPARKGLDRAAIDAKIEETAAVSALLAGIFTDQEEAEEEKATAPGPVELPQSCGIPGLSAGESAFAVALFGRGSWSRAEVEELAADHQLMVDGALEAVNEAAFELCGGPLSEGDEPIDIDPEIAKEMVA
jgi:tellurite resistance protein